MVYFNFKVVLKSSMYTSLMDRKTIPTEEDFKESENGSSSIGIQTIEQNNFDMEESPPDNQRFFRTGKSNW